LPLKEFLTRWLSTWLICHDLKKWCNIIRSLDVDWIPVDIVNYVGPSSTSVYIRTLTIAAGQTYSQKWSIPWQWTLRQQAVQCNHIHDSYEEKDWPLSTNYKWFIVLFFSCKRAKTRALNFGKINSAILSFCSFHSHFMELCFLVITISLPYR
jgi:hypothetical protein